MEELYQEYGEEGFLPITLHGEAGEQDDAHEPTEGDLLGWADTYGLTHPVLADPGFSNTYRFVVPDEEGGLSIAMPTLTLLAPGLKVVWRNRNRSQEWEFSGADIEEYLPDDYHTDLP